MFPLIHHFVNKKIYSAPSPLMIIGGMWPDLASGAIPHDRSQGNRLRNLVHRNGEAFYHWCQKHTPDSLDLARGIVSHGLCPKGVDYYADEVWPGCAKGWCFAIGGRYVHLVAEATKMPPGYRWWKAHNFVEMSYDLLAQEENPTLSDELLAAVQDEAALTQAATVLSSYYQLEKEDLTALFHRIPQIYAIDHPTPLMLAQRQKKSFAFKPGITQSEASISAMAELLERMKAELQDNYHAFMARLLELLTPDLSRY